MIHGVGIDIVKTERMRAAVERWGDRFLERVFTEDEIAYCYRKKEPYLSLSVRFAAKEAFVKAIGSGAPVSLREIEVTNLSGGRPQFVLKGRLSAFFEEKEIRCAHLSLSHEKEFGVACVVIEK